MAFRRPPEPEAKAQSPMTLEIVSSTPVPQLTATVVAEPPKPAKATPSPTEALQNLSHVADALRKMTAEITELRSKNAQLAKENEEHAQRMATLRAALNLDGPGRP